MTNLMCVLNCLEINKCFSRIPILNCAPLHMTNIIYYYYNTGVVYSLKNAVAMHIPYETSIPSDQQLITRSCPRRLAPRESPVYPYHDVQHKYIRLKPDLHSFGPAFLHHNVTKTRNTLMMRP